MNFQLNKADKVWYPRAEEELMAAPPAYVNIKPCIFVSANGHIKTQHREYFSSMKKLKEKTVHHLKGVGVRKEIEKAAYALGGNTCRTMQCVALLYDSSSF